MLTFTLAISYLTTSNLPCFMDLDSRFLCNIALYSIGLYFYHQSHPQLGVVFVLAASLHSFWSYFSTDLQYHIGHLLTWGVPLSVSCLFAFSYCSWGSQGKNTEVACHSLLQWTTALSNSVKPSHACRATQDGWVTVERCDRMWSTREGNGKPLQCSCLENPMNSMKRQNDTILKGELPELVGAEYATGDQWRNNSKKN